MKEDTSYFTMEEKMNLLSRQLSCAIKRKTWDSFGKHQFANGFSVLRHCERERESNYINQ